MRLHHWTHPKKEIEFDIDVGQGKVIEIDSPRDKNSECPGFAFSEKRFFGKNECYAIFKSNNDLVFCAGNLKWVLSNKNLKICHWHPFPFFSRFSISVSGVKEYSITYCHFSRMLYALIDPTYDKIDQDSDFFLEFIAENAGSEEWQLHAKNHWYESSST